MFSDFFTWIVVVASFLTGGWIADPTQIATEPQLGLATFKSVQLATDPDNGEVLSTNGTDNTWSSAGAGDITGGTSLGSGTNIFDLENSGILQFNEISAGTNISFSTTSNANTIVISSTASGGGGDDPFTHPTAFGTTTSATTTPIWAKFGIFASSTLIADNSTTTNATTTNLAVSGLTASRSVFTNAISGLTTTGTIGALESSIGSENIILFSEIDTCAELRALIDYETGTCGELVLSNSPTFSAGDISLGGAGVKATGDDGILTLLGLGDGNDENLTFDFDNGAANSVVVNTGTAVSTIDWSAISRNVFNNASTTRFTALDEAKFGATATTTINSAGNVLLPAAGTLTIPALTSALLLTDGNGLLGEFAGTSCTNQFPQSVSAAGAWTCDSVVLTTDVSGDLPFANLAQVSANSVLANPTNATADAQSVATSTLFGATAPAGYVLMSNGSSWLASATSTAKRIFGVTVASTSPYFIGATNLATPVQDTAYTMTKIQCYVVSGTSKAIQITDGTNATESITCGTTLTSDDGTITNAAVTVGELMYIDFGSTVGSVDTVSISVFGQ